MVFRVIVFLCCPARLAKWRRAVRGLLSGRTTSLLSAAGFAFRRQSPANAGHFHVRSDGSATPPFSLPTRPGPNPSSDLRRNRSGDNADYEEHHPPSVQVETSDSCLFQLLLDFLVARLAGRHFSV